MTMREAQEPLLSVNSAVENNPGDKKELENTEFMNFDRIHSINNAQSDQKTSGKIVVIAILLMFVSAICFSTLGVLVTYGRKLGYGSSEMLMCRGSGQCIAVFFMMLVKKECNHKLLPKDDQFKRNILWLILRGVFGATSAVLYFYSITIIDLGDAIS
eukprot:132637_1